MEIWTLDGIDTVIMVITAASQMQPDQLLDSVTNSTRSQFGSKNVRETTSSIRLGGRPVSGKRLVVQVGSVVIHQDFFAFRRGESAVLLILQGTPENGKPTDENRRVRQLLNTSFRLIS